MNVMVWHLGVRRHPGWFEGGQDKTPATVARYGSASQSAALPFRYQTKPAICDVFPPPTPSMILFLLATTLFHLSHLLALSSATTCQPLGNETACSTQSCKWCFAQSRCQEFGQDCCAGIATAACADTPACRVCGGACQSQTHCDQFAVCSDETSPAACSQNFQCQWCDNACQSSIDCAEEAGRAVMRTIMVVVGSVLGSIAFVCCGVIACLYFASRNRATPTAIVVAAPAPQPHVFIYPPPTTTTPLLSSTREN